MENEVKLEQFIGIFPNAINDDLCSEFVKWFDEVSEQGLTMSAMQDSRSPGILRKDEVIHIPRGLPVQCFPEGLCKSLWKNISECLTIYRNEYNLTDMDLTSDGFNANRAQPSGGYHLWHHEWHAHVPYRILVWMLILETPKSGGETEFLHQSLRIEPIAKQLTIWPTAFTHKHRGNPPLEGHKTYITGWFESFDIGRRQREI